VTVIYGQRGQPAATIVDDALFAKDGTQIGFVDDGLIYSMVDGGHIGSYVSGVVFSAFGDTEGFSASCSPAIPLMTPRLAMLPPRISAIGDDIRELPDRAPPEFLRAALAKARSEWFK
jgi:hypothetical protein